MSLMSFHFHVRFALSSALFWMMYLYLLFIYLIAHAQQGEISLAILNVNKGRLYPSLAHAHHAQLSVRRLEQPWPRLPEWTCTRRGREWPYSWLLHWNLNIDFGAFYLPTNQPTNHNRLGYPKFQRAQPTLTETVTLTLTLPLPLAL